MRWAFHSLCAVLIGPNDNCALITSGCFEGTYVVLWGQNLMKWDYIRSSCTADPPMRRKHRDNKFELCLKILVGAQSEGKAHKG
ncbi:hypothetical protein FA13DRAFT_803569 [Coprinellus micaceus]|uniref:Uncharacterized protein n=1 Tax=Coprinellus micaceus TaxID=71717 RepID=A0A4Y7T2B0_COPMI|nr:hypothetical protein FA13DRAFT_803569 [Coprinellus micaceus]